MHFDKRCLGLHQRDGGGPPPPNLLHCVPAAPAFKFHFMARGSLAREKPLHIGNSRGTLLTSDVSEKDVILITWVPSYKLPTRLSQQVVPILRNTNAHTQRTHRTHTHADDGILFLLASRETLGG